LTPLRPSPPVNFTPAVSLYSRWVGSLSPIGSAPFLRRPGAKGGGTQHWRCRRNPSRWREPTTGESPVLSDRDCGGCGSRRMPLAGMPSASMMSVILRLRCRNCGGPATSAAIENTLSGWRHRIVRVWGPGSFGQIYARFTNQTDHRTPQQESRHDRSLCRRRDDLGRRPTARCPQTLAQGRKAVIVRCRPARP
jgi:hypothetical protein